MALDRSIRAGETINLRSRILDDLGDSAQASGVLITIYKPDETSPFEVGSPVYWTDGIFEYSFTTPTDGPDGVWTDVWTAELNGQSLRSEFSFEVSASGVITSLDDQLYKNNIVTVTIDSGILSSDGSSMEEDYEFSFLTEITPAYTDSSKVELEVGSVLTDVEDDTIYLAILEASLEANALNFQKTNLNSDFFKHARREWTTCRAAAVLATNARAKIINTRKTLGDFTVEYDPNALSDLLDRIVSCLHRWEPQLTSGGYATQTPVGTIKGEYDYDRPMIGRSWVSNSEGTYISRRVPAANSKMKNDNSRRWKKGYKGRW
ncbi:hypothetical protein GF373_17460 [bacterium]|nr:hypothetical protein [bacterium]